MEHEHKWGALTHSRYAGTLHRPCIVVRCNIISLDLEDDEDDWTLGSCGCTDYHMADCPTRTASTDNYDYEEEDWR